jgi:hypothetical protein
MSSDRESPVPELLTPNGHPGDGRVQATVRVPWEPWDGETGKAYAAFTLYLHQGASRSLRAVAEECTKHESLIRRWSARWNWRQRALAYDNAQARIIQAATARHLAEQAAQYSRIASDRLAALTPEEKASLSVHETALCSKMALELSGNGESVNGFPANLPQPVFYISLIPQRPQGYVYVRFGDGPTSYTLGDPIPEKVGFTWIREEDVEQYRKDHPDHVIIA